jgi:tRNA pseudouridine38-40 synthase
VPSADQVVPSADQDPYTRPLPTGQRIALVLEYDGAPFNGWQLQQGNQQQTVQGALESALSTVAAAPVRVHCAGRTDAGVHADYQVVHFDSPTERAPRAWREGVNTELPAAVVVRHAQAVDQEFHARFSATARRYRYIILNRPVRPALLSGCVTWVRQPLDAGQMHDAAQSLLGERDFSAFRAASCQSSTAMRRVDFIEVFRAGEFVVIDIQANAFLHHMVRNIAGTLIAVGRGRQGGHWPAELLAGRDRTRAADTAASAGLYLVGVSYPERFGLPLPVAGPGFLRGLPG